MTAPRGGSDETRRGDSELLFVVQEDIRRILAEGGTADPQALAARHRVAPVDVERCLAGVVAMGAGGEASAATVNSAAGTSSPGADLAPPPLPEDYEILGELGRGGMAVVYRARQRALDRVVAVKVLRPGEMFFDGMLRRFEKEAQTLARLRHPHIVAIHDVGRAGGNVFFSMDLVEGASLHDLIARGGMTPSRTVKLMRQVVSAVSYAHSRGLIHRDLKPANILVDGEDRAFVADFGLAREISGAEGMTHTGQILGTPAFMAPEQARGDSAAIGEPADTYALGAILYECLTGRLPFEGKPLPELIQAVLHEDPPAPRTINPRVPRDLQVICLKAMEKDPARRYATAQALLEDLERFEEGREIRARPPSVAYRVTRLAARHRGPLATAVVAAAAAGAILWTVVRPLIGATPATLLASGDEALAAGRTDAALFLYERGLEAAGPPAAGGLPPVPTRLRIGLASCLLRLCAREESAGGTDAAAAACARAGETLAPLPTGVAEAVRAECDERGVLLAARRGDAAALLEGLRRPRWSPRSPESHRQGVLDRAAPALADPGDPGHRSAVAALTAALALGGSRDAALWLGERGEEGARLLPEITAALGDLGAGEGAAAALGLEDAVAGLALFHAATMEGPLAAVAADEGVPAPRRILAARLLAACADIPWWPEAAADGPAPSPGELARFWLAGEGLSREENLRRRVDLALQAGEGAAPLRDRWLAARLGPAALAAREGPDAWWRAHREDDPAERLFAACGLRREATPAELLALLSRAPAENRPLLHSLLLLVRPAGTPAPAWTLSPRRPAWTPEPADLESAWQVALRGHVPEPALQVRIAHFISLDGDPELRPLRSEVVPLRVGDRLGFERAADVPPPPAPPRLRVEFQVPDVGAGAWMWASPSLAGAFSARLQVDRRGGEAVLRWSRCRLGGMGSAFGTDEAAEGRLLLRHSRGTLAEGRNWMAAEWTFPRARFYEEWVLARIERVDGPGGGPGPEVWREALAVELGLLADGAAAAAAGGHSFRDGDALAALYAAQCAVWIPAPGAVKALATLDRALAGGERAGGAGPPAPGSDALVPSNFHAARPWRLRPEARSAVFWARLRAGDATALTGAEASTSPDHDWTHRSTALVAAGGDPACRAHVADRLSRQLRLFLTAGMRDRLRAVAGTDPVPGARWMARLPGAGPTGPFAALLLAVLGVVLASAVVLAARPRLPLEARLRPTVLALAISMAVPFLRVEIDGHPFPLVGPGIVAAMALSWVLGAGLRGPARRLRFLVPLGFALALATFIAGDGGFPVEEDCMGIAGARTTLLIVAIPGTLLFVRRICRRADADGVLEPILDPAWGRWAAFLARPARSRESWIAREERRRARRAKSLLPWVRREAALPLEVRRETLGDFLVLPLSVLLSMASWIVAARSMGGVLGSAWFAAAPAQCAVAVSVPALLLLLVADRRGSPPSLPARLGAAFRRG